ncbi:MAG: UvrD-helicase domain-containing protein [Planctomycetota bacterium]|jgi:superfamily I DNA/RNA helicase|nr:UvrD-helicase domain-containing protein [Planctomycetota bacterium]
MDELNPQQLRAVRHGEGPLLILAGAGTGKTRVVTERLAWLLGRGIKPENLLGVTFTNKAAAEMRSRLAKLAGKAFPASRLVLSTFHSLAVRLLRRDAAGIGFAPDFGICDYGEQAAAVRKAISTIRNGAVPPLEKILSQIGRLKNLGIDPESFSRRALEEDERILAAIYRRYQETLRRLGALDFDDLLLQALRLLRECPDALEHWRRRFHYLMVDEFQDTSQIQFELVRLLAAPRDNLCVVGDDDQSIYAWRGALAGNILKFRECYPGAVSIALEQNYRSRQIILSAANAVIRNNPNRREKNLWSSLGPGRPLRLLACSEPGEEAEQIALAVRRRREEAGSGLRFSDFAVIIRANAQSRPLEDEFLAARLPFEVIGGQSLLDHKETRDILAFLALIAKPGADSRLRRIINVPPRGIGGKTLDLLSARAAREGVGLFRLLAEPEREPEIGKVPAEACRRLARTIHSWRKHLEKNGVSGLVEKILAEVDYQEELRQLYRDPLEIASRWNEAREMGRTLAAFAARDPAAKPIELLAAFVDEASLSGAPESGNRKRKGDAVSIITVHSAKGLEFSEVFLAGLEEDVFPNRKAVLEGAVEEERRLFYVALTRAREGLSLSWNRARTSRGKECKCFPSRFLSEIPPEFVQAGETPERLDRALAWLADLRQRLG